MSIPRGRHGKALLRQAGNGPALSSSTNCADVLAAAGVEDLFDERANGMTVERDRPAGKPAPDVFLAAAHALGAAPADAAVFEDARAGVAARRAGRSGFVGGVDRAGQPGELQAQGADVAVAELAESLEES
ncbi:MAG TPA: HAD-IA family hydrolase [Streptosporangiaceae bacterium]|nr:HAD-IA family hydrolase [Streptosporangiaceae bacterium]